MLLITLSIVIIAIKIKNNEKKNKPSYCWFRTNWQLFI